MNRDDLLKKCVDRGVADQASVEAVSHLFYVYLLSALQKGQRVEVPNFGTFGTRVVGVKRARKMPYFEVERELADKVNERYRELKYLIVGRYELTPVLGDEEYKGREAPHDTVVDQVGKEMLVDTHRDVTIEEYQRGLASSQSKEKKTMPKLNLKGEDTDDSFKPLEGTTVSSGAALREKKSSKAPSPWLQALIAVLLLGIITFGLNYFGVVHLWGPKASTVAETVAPPETETMPPLGEITETEQGETGLPPAEETGQPPSGEVTPPKTETVTPTPTPNAGVQPADKVPAQSVPPKTTTQTPPQKEVIKPSIPTSGTGQFTVQVSSWSTRTKADAEVTKLVGAGLTAFVADGTVGGERKYRVRVGRYATEKEASAAAAQLSEMMENGIWVARMP